MAEAISVATGDAARKYLNIVLDDLEPCVVQRQNEAGDGQR